MDSLMRESPQYTRGIRAECFMLEPGKTREFERAMGELQQGLWIVKTEERYEPTFSYRWDLLERWLPEATAEGRRLRRAAALDRVLARHLRGAIYSTAATRSSGSRPCWERLPAGWWAGPSAMRFWEKRCARWISR